MNAFVALYETVFSLLARLKWLPPLIARIAVGYVFLESGWGKIHNIDKVIEFFIDLKLPAPAFQAHLVAYTELIAGFLVIIGLFTRLASIPLIITMVVAIVTAKAEDLHSMSDLYSTSEFLYIALLIYLVIDGQGRASIDFLLSRRFHRPKGSR